METKITVNINIFATMLILFDIEFNIELKFQFQTIHAQRNEKRSATKLTLTFSMSRADAF